MWNTPTPEQLATIPKLYETEHIPMKEKIVHFHFFIGGCDWFVVEFDGVDTFFVFAILHGDLHNAEWGYTSLSELKSIKAKGYLEIDCDLYWKPRPAGQVEVICKAQGWPSTTKNNSQKGGKQWHTLPN
ncbi:hypothetical protein HRM2_19440 [Desulforapulum autotrophicum HRM2]|uniref:DUF2958 domain-containing protein n=1 Tax=Desulforapulum autotrophicum (strain ATCC 43914 / DSM 3382 / VKM B-1955 / HRM2) TaxID=177437 RepID=C0QCG8_DESAH|nr:DUF2958 domain-containing protein [Desulforapulum autotrophicum]ACN15045.1 hypothetical protein HRM2_19440 [Desulforapulum autotrophicum HRM2]